MAFNEIRRSPVRVVVADDHPVFREGLIRLLETRPDLIVVGQASDGQEAMQVSAGLQPDVLLLDVAMPGTNGLAALRAMQQTGTHTRVILVTAAIERADIVVALRLGARGIVTKASASEVLWKCIRAVMGGEYWVGRNRVTDLENALREVAEPARGVVRRQFGLTPRELEMIAAILAGFTNIDIAGRFGISEKTVKHHLTNIFDKLGVSNRLELALFALHHNLVAQPIAADVPQVAIGPAA
jgi:DNA-binding NarL/FixJ family response regulator